MSKSDQSSNYPKPPHPHAELIKAWADGALIEVYDSISLKWVNINNPNWETHSRYRIKPIPAPKKYFRVFEVTWSRGQKTLSAYPKDHKDLNRLLDMPDARPISDWIEYE